MFAEFCKARLLLRIKPLTSVRGCFTASCLGVSLRPRGSGCALLTAGRRLDNMLGEGLDLGREAFGAELAAPLVGSLQKAGFSANRAVAGRRIGRRCVLLRCRASVLSSTSVSRSCTRRRATSATGHFSVRAFASCSASRWNSTCVNADHGKRRGTDSAAHLREYLTRAGDRDVTIEVYPNAGHQLIVSKSGYNGDPTLPERFVPQYPQIMITWLAQPGFTKERML